MVIDLAISTGLPIQLIVSRGPNLFQSHDPSILPCGLHRARESVRRVSGFVEVGFWEVAVQGLWRVGSKPEVDHHSRRGDLGFGS